MVKPKVFVIDPYHPDAVHKLRNTDWIDLTLKDDQRREDWREETDAILIRSETKIAADDVSKAKRLKAIVKQGVGVDNIDLEACKQHGIAVCNTPALNSESVAELTITLALCIARRVAEIDRRVRRGEAIVRSQTLGQSLFEKQIGIIGMGNIGKVVAQKWIAAMSGSVVGYDPFASADAWQKAGIKHSRVDDLNELLRIADVVTLHVPLTSGTRNMIGHDQLALMKSNAILINAARGGVVDESALLLALKEKRIYGAALDAMNVEPPTLKAYEDLLENENLIMTPHVGSSTRENQSNSGLAVVDTVLSVLRGEEVPNRLV